MAAKAKSEIARFVRTVTKDLKVSITGEVTFVRFLAYYRRDLGIRALWFAIA